ncbi:hypothetical protein [Ruminococcus sp.]|jgi:hypothetical protein|uniref:hypothetical protein n=1 Tax=Ruminococcus sp. TaxID=41978 RepID=UPI002059DBE5|nr:hypothetical protein [Ruminococcus sp.]DAY99127.1 MAG TPA: hypothetical protein [Caudoviricetes sp.]
MKYSKQFAAQVLQFNSQWENTNQSVIADNVEKYLYAKYPECKESYNVKMDKLIDITKSKKDSIYSWLNRSRENVKVPLLKLCMLAVAFDVNVNNFLEVD